MTDQIHSMRSYFWRPNHQVDTVAFAAGVLRQAKLIVRRQLDETGFVQAAIAPVLVVELGDPSQPVDAPVTAYINNGAWLARCGAPLPAGGECGGVEFVDLGMPLMMCCGCWNATYGHQWRPVVVPRIRAAIERVLLVRPAPNRNWRGESLPALKAENVANGLPESV